MTLTVALLFHHRNAIIDMRIITWLNDSKVSVEKMDRVKKKIKPSLLKSKSFRYVSFRRKKDKTNSDYAHIVPNLGKSWTVEMLPKICDWAKYQNRGASSKSIRVTKLSF